VLHSNKLLHLKTRFHIAVSVGPLPQPALRVQRVDSELKAGIAGFPKRLLTALLLVAFAMAALVVALVIGSVIALVLWGALAIAVVSMILRISFRRTGQQEHTPAPPSKVPSMKRKRTTKPRPI
jgi:xanthine/uracil/vitamin C permease (AzgA family)